MAESLIVIDVKGKEVALPLKDAKELYKTLHDIFGYNKEEVNIQDHTHYHSIVNPIIVPKQNGTDNNPMPPRWQC